jgi:enamine deaminase RidA (YjgF/YER057c/UK114 family)
MLVEPIEAPDAPPAEGGYAQALRVAGAGELLFVSGQVPVDSAGDVPAAFGDQCRLVWRNVEAQLRAAGMGLGDIVKVTTFLSRRAYAEENSAIRRELLAGHAPALTVVIADIFDPAWLLEIEVIAARRAA